MVSAVASPTLWNTLKLAFLNAMRLKLDFLHSIGLINWT